MYDLNKATPNKMYGLNIKTLITTEKVTFVVDVTTTDEFTSEGTNILTTQDSWFFMDDKVLIDTLTFGAE